MQFSVSNVSLFFTMLPDARNVKLKVIGNE